MAIGAELVPVKDLRTLHNYYLPPNYQLQHHDDRLTREEAEFIRNTYAPPEVYGIVHGTVWSATETHAELAANGDLPTRHDYAVAAGIVDSLRPGIDTLFIEGIGHRTAMFEAVFPKEAYVDEEGKDRPPAEIAYAKRLYAQIMARQYAVSTIEYASLIAESRGIAVVYADLDEFDDDHMDAILPRQPGELRSDTVQHARGRTAVNIIKDWALDHASHIQSLAHDTEPPRLVSIVGYKHTEQLEQQFNIMGIDAYARRVVHSTREESIAEQRAIAAGWKPDVLHLNFPRPALRQSQDRQ